MNWYLISLAYFSNELFIFFSASQVALVIKNLPATAEDIFLLGTYIHSLCILEKHVSQPITFIIAFYHVLFMVLCPRNISEVFMYFFNWVWVVLYHVLKNLAHICMYTHIYMLHIHIYVHVMIFLPKFYSYFSFTYICILCLIWNVVGLR